MHRSLLLDGSTPQCEQITLLFEGEGLSPRPLSPPSSSNRFELQHYICYWCVSFLLLTICRKGSCLSLKLGVGSYAYQVFDCCTRRFHYFLSL